MLVLISGTRVRDERQVVIDRRPRRLSLLRRARRRSDRRQPRPLVQESAELGHVRVEARVVVQVNARADRDRELLRRDPAIGQLGVVLVGGLPLQRRLQSRSSGKPACHRACSRDACRTWPACRSTSCRYRRTNRPDMDCCCGFSERWPSSFSHLLNWMLMLPFRLRRSSFSAGLTPLWLR